MPQPGSDRTGDRLVVPPDALRASHPSGRSDTGFAGGPLPASARLCGALDQAAAAIARLDQALDAHPLRPAFLYRCRLEAVRRQAAVDGHAIDPWHLAAMLEGLWPRFSDAADGFARAAMLDAAHAALAQHQWITRPDFDEEGEIRSAGRCLTAAPQHPSALVAAAGGVHAWLARGGRRAPMRAALIRFWVQRGLLRAPVPLTGPRALAAEARQPTPPHGRRSSSKPSPARRTTTRPC